MSMVSLEFQSIRALVVLEVRKSKLETEALKNKKLNKNKRF